jgi:hypothetical protein
MHLESAMLAFKSLQEALSMILVTGRIILLLFCFAEDMRLTNELFLKKYDGKTPALRLQITQK